MADSKATVFLVGGGNIIAGKEIMLLTLARGLKNAGFNVEVITSIWGGKDEFVSRLKSEGLRFHRIRLGFISKTLQWKPMLWTLDQLRYWPSLALGYLKAIKAGAPKVVVHTNWHHALLLLPFINRQRDFYWSHEIVPENWLYGHIFRAIAKRVKCVVCVSHAVARSLIASRVDSAKICVIYNGIVEFECIRSDVSALPPGTCIGIAGQIGAWKGHEDLIEAFGILAKNHEGLVLKICGRCEDEFAERLRARISELGLARRVMWAGFVQDRARVYADMDICVVPSRFEDPLPTSAIEAGFLGLPVIATETGGLSEIVEHGRTGLLVPVGMPNQLADAIDQLVRSPELRRSMGIRGKERMVAMFSEQRFVDEFGNLLLGNVRERKVQ